jgi:hypothetical protein
VESVLSHVYDGNATLHHGAESKASSNMGVRPDEAG